jgi:TonB family protein
MRIGPCTLLLALSFAPALHLQAAYVLPGMVISKPNPVYPPDAKAAHRQGSVVLHFTVTKAGTVENLTIVSGPEEFRQSAIDAVSEWKYRPYRQNGEPVEKDQTITINFAMDNSSAAVAPGAPVLHPQAESAQTAAPAATSAPAACTCPSPTVAQRHLPPYSAKQKITRVQTLANGTNITTVTTSQVWRDADGRTRTDTTNTLADGTTYHYIRIYDQANRVQLT